MTPNEEEYTTQGAVQIVRDATSTYVRLCGKYETKLSLLEEAMMDLASDKIIELLVRQDRKLFGEISTDSVKQIIETLRVSNASNIYVFVVCVLLECLTFILNKRTLTENKREFIVEVIESHSRAPWPGNQYNMDIKLEDKIRG